MSRFPAGFSREYVGKYFSGKYSAVPPPPSLCEDSSSSAIDADSGKAKDEQSKEKKSSKSSSTNKHKSERKRSFRSPSHTNSHRSGRSRSSRSSSHTSSHKSDHLSRRSRSRNYSEEKSQSYKHSTRHSHDKKNSKRLPVDSNTLETMLKVLHHKKKKEPPLKYTFIEDYRVGYEETGHIIGTLTDVMKSESGCDIQFPYPDDERRLKLIGTKRAIDETKQLIQRIIERVHHSTGMEYMDVLELEDPHKVEMIIPANKVKLLMGAGGALIEMLKKRTQTQIDIIQDESQKISMEKTLVVRGEPSHCRCAQQVVENFIEIEHTFHVSKKDSRKGSVQNNTNTNELDTQESTFYVPAIKCSQIIHEILQQTGAYVQVSKPAPFDPTKNIIKIRGNAMQLYQAQQLIYADSSVSDSYQQRIGNLLGLENVRHPWQKDLSSINPFVAATNSAEPDNGTSVLEHYISLVSDLLEQQSNQGHQESLSSGVGYLEPILQQFYEQCSEPVQFQQFKEGQNNQPATLQYEHSLSRQNQQSPMVQYEHSFQRQDQQLHTAHYENSLQSHQPPITRYEQRLEGQSQQPPNIHYEHSLSGQNQQPSTSLYNHSVAGQSQPSPITLYEHSLARQNQQPSTTLYNYSLTRQSQPSSITRYEHSLAGQSQEPPITPYENSLAGHGQETPITQFDHHEKSAGKKEHSSLVQFEHMAGQNQQAPIVHYEHQVGINQQQPVANFEHQARQSNPPPKVQYEQPAGQSQTSPIVQYEHLAGQSKQPPLVKYEHLVGQNKPPVVQYEHLTGQNKQPSVVQYEHLLGQNKPPLVQYEHLLGKNQKPSVVQYEHLLEDQKKEKEGEKSS